MSLEAVRRDVVATRKDQLTDARRQLRARRRELRSVTNLIAKNAALNALISSSYGSKASPPPDADELAWLNASDVSNGRRFEDASLPFPAIPPYTDTTHTSKPLRPSSHPTDRVHDSIEAGIAIAEQAIASDLGPLASDNLHAPDEIQDLSLAEQNGDEDGAAAITYVQKAREESNGPVAAPGLVAPPQPEDQAKFSRRTQELLDSERPSKPAKVVHLPPEDVQRERLREVEEERRRRSEEEANGKASRHAPSQAEMASSPSSTVGAHSTATPVPPQDSPDTSPDSESAGQDEVLPPKDLRPSPEEQREKEEHDRILEAQKEIARREALGGLSTPDDQLRYEERQATARDADERFAREARNGPEPDAKDEREETAAEEVMEGVESAERMDQPATKAREPRGTSEDGENIHVKHRSRHSLSIDTGRSHHTSAGTPLKGGQSEQHRTVHRLSSAASPQRRVSDNFGHSPFRGGQISPGGGSAVALRRDQEDLVATSMDAAIALPHRLASERDHPRSIGATQSLLDALDTLKGASEDPNRDYLEPLFRIQAHDTPQIHTTPLPDLIRSSTKTLSTEDHFSTMHERMDYRILRRIYHLQNANKWSLRQMLHCKEPEQPVTHQDHMMAEMQWMHKDFEAERKMKKSICAWLAHRCADWVAASPEERTTMQVQVRPPSAKQTVEANDAMPELDRADDSPSDDAGPPTPPNEPEVIPTNLVVPPELFETVALLQKDGQLGAALEHIPVAEMSDLVKSVHITTPLTPASKFAVGKVLPKAHEPPRKRSRFDYDDDAELPEALRDAKRVHLESDQAPEDQDSALFHPDNKPIRDRLHANNAFRPPSEFVMPSTQFYEYRNGSQWLKEDDDKLKKLAKDYAFNWSLIADELQLTGIFKSSSERRTPWECFERWVELEQLPAEMKKTIYFKTWYQRLEQSQQAAERRYQAQVAALQAASNGQATHVPLRRRTVPSRVEKRKNSRYIWLVDAMRKLARKKEQQAYKQAEAQRAAAQRKTSKENNPSRPPMLTPLEFSRKRQEGDVRAAEKLQQDRARLLQAQQRQYLAARQAAQQQQQSQQAQQQAQQQTQSASNGTAGQLQRPGSSTSMSSQQASGQANGQHQAQVNGQLSQQARQNMQMAQRAGHLAVPQMNAQGVPQAQMRPNAQMNAQDMARLAQAHANIRAGMPAYPSGHPYPMPNANMMSPGGSGMSTQQVGQSRQAMLANVQQQMSSAGQQGNQQASASPSMPPPPAPQNNPQSLSSGHVPALMNIRQQLRNRFPDHSDEQINVMATEVLKNHSQSSSQARQSAMNAAAGINGNMSQHSNMQAYAHNQAAYANSQMGSSGTFVGADGSTQQAGMNPTSPQQYAALLRQRQMQQLQNRMQASPNATHATLNGSPGMAHASPNMQPASPNLQYSNMNQMASMNMGGQQTSRSNTPQMPRVGSSGNIAGGMSSPGLQGSPRADMQAAR